MAQTYAVVYDTKANFFIATKNTKGYFYHTGGGVIYKTGFPIKNGPGLSALPGGGLAADDPAIGAADEFFEETGVQLRDFDSDLKPAEWHEGQGNSEYYGVYFLVSDGDFQTICKSAADHIAKGALAVADIAAGKITSYADIFKSYPTCPQDNELASAHTWNLDADGAQIDALKSSKSTDWFYNILKNLQKKR